MEYPVLVLRLRLVECEELIRLNPNDRFAINCRDELRDAIRLLRAHHDQRS